MTGASVMAPDTTVGRVHKPPRAVQQNGRQLSRVSQADTDSCTTTPRPYCVLPLRSR